jgi:hypothetical protein
MLRQIFTEAIETLHNRLHKTLRLSPNTVISPAERISILLKTHPPQNARRSTKQKVGSSSLSGRATAMFCITFCESTGSHHTRS